MVAFWNFANGDYILQMVIIFSISVIIPSRGRWEQRAIESEYASLGIVDGAARAAEVAIAGLISELKIIDESQIEKFRNRPVINSTDQIIGHMKWLLWKIILYFF